MKLILNVSEPDKQTPHPRLGWVAKSPKEVAKELAKKLRLIVSDDRYCRVFKAKTHFRKILGILSGRLKAVFSSLDIETQ